MANRTRSPVKFHPHKVAKTLAKMDRDLDVTREAVAADIQALYVRPFQRIFGKIAAKAASGRDKPSLQLLRHLAGVYYATDPHGCGVQELRQTALFADVSRRTLIEWSANDNWPDKRREYWNLADDLVIRRVAEELTQTRMHQLKKLELVWESGVNKLINNLVPASSWEGVANAVRQLTSEIDALRCKVAESQAVNPATLAPASMGETLEVSESAAREAALYLLDKLQRQQLEAARDVTPDEDADDQEAEEEEEEGA